METSEDNSTLKSMSEANARRVQFSEKEPSLPKPKKAERAETVSEKRAVPRMEPVSESAQWMGETKVSQKITWYQ